MMKLVDLLPVVMVLGLIGCATAQPMPRDVMEHIATGVYIVKRCATEGTIPASSVRDYQNVYINQVRGYQYSTEEMGETVEQVSRKNAHLRMPANNCNTVSIAIENARPTQSQAAPTSRNSSTQTFCNNIGGITLCNAHSY